MTTRDDDEGGGAHVGSLPSEELDDGCCEAALRGRWLLVTRVVGAGWRVRGPGRLPGGGGDGGTSSSKSCSESLSLAGVSRLINAGLSLAKATISDPLPGNCNLNPFGLLDRTRNGPS